MVGSVDPPNRFTYFESQLSKKHGSVAIIRIAEDPVREYMDLRFVNEVVAELGRR
jgi:hypothetical protein